MEQQQERSKRRNSLLCIFSVDGRLFAPFLFFRSVHLLSVDGRFFAPFLFFRSVITMVVSARVLHLFCRLVLYGALVMHIEQGRQSFCHPHFPSLRFFIVRGVVCLLGTF
jgi:hypothetical protein